VQLDDEKRRVLAETKGFMPDVEGEALFLAAREICESSVAGPIVEIGSYCGRSTIWLGAAAHAAGRLVVTVDHHRGSEETQAGWEYHDPDVVDPRTQKMDTLPFLRRTLFDADLEDTVIVVVGNSPNVAAVWSKEISMLFIDGGHGAEQAATDYGSWVPHVASGGVLAIHDVFADPSQGGQAPHDEIYRPALDSGEFVEVSRTGSLRLLRRL